MDADKPLPARAQEVFDFWFFPGWLEELVRVLNDGKRLWWHTKDLEVDRRIATQFSHDLTRAEKGDYDDWLESSRGALAFIILVDQMPRHIYRGDPRAFSFDPLALASCRKAMARGLDKPLNSIERYFFYLPFMHDEDIKTQSEGLVLYEELYRTAPENLNLAMKIVLGAARRHHEIIERFGRFPHRNAALSRHSTPDEIAFLDEPHSSF